MPPAKRGVLRRWWRALLKEHADPKSLGLGVAIGVLVGCSPFFGLQTLIALAVASLLRLNRISVLLGAQISIPPLTPLVIFGGAQVGELLLHQRLLPMTLADFRAMAPAELLRLFLVDLGVGGLALGTVLGAGLGSLTTVVLRRRRAHPGLPGLGEARLDAIEDRSRPLGRRFRSYAFWKLRMDPVYALALPHLARAEKLVDLGAGLGLLSVLGALENPRLSARAVEWDAAKAKQARLLADGLAVEVVEGDAHQVELGTPDAVALVDLLHYVPVEAQRRLLERCAEALAPGGLLLIRDLGEPGRWAERLDRLAVRVGWNRGAGVQAWTAKEMTECLTGAGLTVEVQPAGSGPFRANVLLVAKKPV